MDIVQDPAGAKHTPEVQGDEGGKSRSIGHFSCGWGQSPKPCPDKAATAGYQIEAVPLYGNISVGERMTSCRCMFSFSSLRGARDSRRPGSDACVRAFVLHVTSPKTVQGLQDQLRHSSPIQSARQHASGETHCVGGVVVAMSKLSKGERRGVGVAQATPTRHARLHQATLRSFSYPPLLGPSRVNCTFRLYSRAVIPRCKPLKWQTIFLFSSPSSRRDGRCSTDPSTTA